MLPKTGSETYPRPLDDLEKDYIRKLLPIDRPGYKKYNDKLDDLYILGTGRFQQDDYVLGKMGDEPDFTAPAESMLAVGTIFTQNHKIEISLHEEFEEKIELDFAVTGEGELNPVIKSYWTYSEWSPGQLSPEDNKLVREVRLIDNEAVVAIAPQSKRIWVYESESGVNHLIPVTNFYNEIMRIKNIRDPKVALNVQRLFTHLNEITDNEIIQGFLMYNKYLNKIKIDYSLYSQKEKKVEKPFFKLFGGRKS